MPNPNGGPNHMTMTVEQVRRLQRILKAQGIYHGRLDGQLRPGLTRAISTFQRRNGLPVTGNYDTAMDQFLADTFRQLGASSADIEGLDARTRRYIQENYGYLMAYLRIPEVGRIIIDAAQHGWDEARLTGALQRTDWWREQPTSVRAWQRDIFENPADVARRRAAQEADIRDQMLLFGIELRPRRLSRIVEESLMYGWSQSQIADALAAEAHYNGGDLPPGSITTDVREIEELRRRYFLPDAERNSWQQARRVARGELTVEDLEALFARRAADQYSHLSDQLGDGISMRDLFDGHIQAIAEELELDPDSIDLTQPRWADVVTYNAPGGTDRARSMTLGETRRLARSQGGFRRTDRGREQAANLASTIATRFGRFGG